MARFRPTARLIGLSPDPATVRALALSWGITSMSIGRYSTTDELVWFAVESAVQNGLIHAGSGGARAGRRTRSSEWSSHRRAANRPRP